MRTVFSSIRLCLGCFALLLGISWIFGPNVDPTSLHISGLIVGAAGLALTLQETAFIHSRFMRGDDKQ